MEQIKKYNYKDPLHQKGDPFGATEAKVAHVNAVIDEVNLISDSVSGFSGDISNLDSRVRVLETPVNSIKGNIRTIPNSSLFAIEIVENNTLIDSVSLQSAFQFKVLGDGSTYVFVVDQTIVVEAEQNGQTISANITNTNIQDFTIVDDWGLANIFNAVDKPFLGLSITPDYGFISGGGLSYLFTMYARILDLSALPDISGNRAPIPQISSNIPIIHFNLTFSTLDLTVV